MSKKKGTFPNKATQFSSTNQPKKNGRKKKIYTILKSMGYGKDDVTTALMELPFYSIKKLEELKEDEKLPAIVRIISAHLIEAFEDDDLNAIKLILDHIVGLPKQTIETDITTKGESVSNSINVTYTDLNSE